MWRAVIFTATLAVVSGCASRYVDDFSDDVEPDGESFVEYWYGSKLRFLREERLCCADGSGAETIRFTWIRSFHEPVVIRMDRVRDGIWTLRTKIGNTRGSRFSGRLTVDQRRRLTDDEANRVLMLVKTDAEFWSLPPDVELMDKDGNVLIGLDGSNWIVEVRRNGRYHGVDRWAPDDGVIHDIGSYLISLSGQQFGSVY